MNDGVMATSAPEAPSQPSLLPCGGNTPDIVAFLARSSPADRLRALGSTPEGLTVAEAERRLAICGPNEVLVLNRPSRLRALGRQFTHTLALLLWLAAGLAFAANIPELGGAILTVIVVNGAFAFVQEYRAEQTVAALLRQVTVMAHCLRDGQEVHLPSSALVPGDVIRLSTGDVAPADCVLLRAENLTLDLSLLTGETQPVERRAEPYAGNPRMRLVDWPPIVPAGSGVVTGSGEAVVFATGAASSVGMLSALISDTHRGPSALERELSHLSRVTLIVATLTSAATLVLLALTTDTSMLVALTFATGVLVALVPEGLLPTLTIALAAGAARMARRGAAIRRLSAVEIVGSVTVICTDKTGTLTENRLTVLQFVGPDGSTSPTQDAMLCAVLCNDAQIHNGEIEGDPIDVALLQWALATGVNVAAIREAHPRLAEVPFDAHRRYMSVTCQFDDGAREFAKGAPETLLPLLTTDSLPAPLASALETATHQGERVLLLAGGSPGQPLAPIGLVLFHDPPRPGVPEAVAACRKAGIRVIMVTGDHPATAMALARRIGLPIAPDAAYQGEEIDSMTDADLLAALRTDAIVARVDPRQKFRIVSLLRQAGEIVVVTGDGINDAPALRAADVGVAMGRRGTEIAKQAADIVLTDDNFATIVAAIEQGRTIKANIRRFVSYVFTSNVAELAPFLVYVFFSVPLPLSVLQVLAIDLGTDLLPALALGLEPASPQIMRRPPERPSVPLLTRQLALRTFLFFGMIEAALGLAAYALRFWAEGWRPFASLALYQPVAREAATLTFLGIVSGQIGCVFAQRDGSLRERLSLRTNPWLAFGLIVEVGLALALVYVPGLNRVFSMEAIHPAWLLILPGGAAIFLALDLLRRQVERR